MKTRVKRLLLALLIVPAAPALACECRAPTNLEQTFGDQFQRAAAVFRGVSSARRPVTVDGVDCENYGRLSADERFKCWATTEVEFVVSQVWKGNVLERMAVRTAPQGASCGVGLEQGLEYIVFAYRIPNEDAAYVHLCSPTRAKGWSLFDDVVAFLGRLPSAVPRRSGR
jgi:hypothetical protein